ncbi:hypothetical protein D8674_028283 [Pyrus ussuriensis x Pyrus communis]|uniref:Uncharacterized protein n=1 Tax=Pyrus ussuriensis x Pyrus communis TaxID=2448454 RepID=A0A5N5HVR8_9ROSA|nr:hypothetical protein D8674_028283 [Pyrus ussuriensis x Pyrus communis]
MGDLGGISASGSGGEDDDISIDDGGDEQISVSGNGGEDDEISCDDGGDEQSVGEEDVLEPPPSTGGGGDDKISSDDGGDEQISVSSNGGGDNKISSDDGRMNKLLMKMYRSRLLLQDGCGDLHEVELLDGPLVRQSC